MPGIPQRQLLVGQTIAYLEAKMAAGEWRDWLPAERTLGEMLQVSRSTLRRALAQLARAGRIRPEQGTGNRILAASRGRRRRRLRSHDAALLLPQPLDRLRPTQTLWLDELRAMLGEHDCRLRVFHGAQYFRANPRAALQRLVRQNPHGCWILAMSSASCQRWFARQGRPCVVAGSCHPGVDLPYCDHDQRAICRHAAGVLIGLGHRRLAYLSPRSRLAGDLDSEMGFLEGVAQSPLTGATAKIEHHDSSVAGVSSLLRRLMTQRPAPSALLVSSAGHCLTVSSRLIQAGFRVPEDVSIISRDDDPFLEYLVPAPARYVGNPRAFAKAMLRPVLDLLEFGVTSRRALRLMPQFFRGASIGPAPRQI